MTRRCWLRLSAVLTTLTALSATAASLTWDAVATAASPGSNDGAGNWGTVANNTN